VGQIWMRKLTKEETWKNLLEKWRRGVGWAKKIGFYFGKKVGGEGGNTYLLYTQCNFCDISLLR